MGCGFLSFRKIWRLCCEKSQFRFQVVTCAFQELESDWQGTGRCDDVAADLGGTEGVVVECCYGVYVLHWWLVAAMGNTEFKAGVDKSGIMMIETHSSKLKVEGNLIASFPAMTGA